MNGNGITITITEAKRTINYLFAENKADGTPNRIFIRVWKGTDTTRHVQVLFLHDCDLRDIGAQVATLARMRTSKEGHVIVTGYGYYSVTDHLQGALELALGRTDFEVKTF
jgi:hypothetical protein